MLSLLTRILHGLFNSFVVNYLARLRVTTHVTTAIVEALPIPRRDHGPRAFSEIASLARRLSRRSDPADAARLQVLVAELYQLTSSEFEHILGTFPLIPQEERDAALRALAALSMAQHQALSVLPPGRLPGNAEIAEAKAAKRAPLDPEQWPTDVSWQSTLSAILAKLGKREEP